MLILNNDEKIYTKDTVADYLKLTFKYLIIQS